MLPIFAIIFLGVIGIILLLVGVSFIKTAIQQIRVVRESRNWPPIVGRIVSSKVEQEIQRNESTEKGPSHYILYRPDVQYEYEVGGVNYQTYQITIGDLPTSRDDDKVQKIVGKYPVHTMVQVYYDPADPKNAVLEPGNFGETWRGVLGGVVCISMAYLLVRIAILIFQSS